MESLHWGPDMTFHGDARGLGKGNAPEELSGLRRPAFNLPAILRARLKAGEARRAALPGDPSRLDEGA